MAKFVSLRGALVYGIAYINITCGIKIPRSSAAVFTKALKAFEGRLEYRLHDETNLNLFSSLLFSSTLNPFILSPDSYRDFTLSSNLKPLIRLHIRMIGNRHGSKVVAQHQFVGTLSRASQFG